MPELTDGILNDLDYVDNKSTWRWHHFVGSNYNHAAGTWAPTTDAWEDIEGCVERASAKRQVSTTRQVQQRLESIQKDAMNLEDLVLEIPMGFDVAIDDTLQKVGSAGNFTGSQYFIVSIDDVTLRSRKRLGLRVA